MSDDPDHVRRWLLNAGGAAIVSSAMGAQAQAQGAAVPAAKAAADPDEPAADGPPSPVTVALTEYVAGALDRDMPPEVVAKTKLHMLDTIAAMVSGSRLKAGLNGGKICGQPRRQAAGDRDRHQHRHLLGQCRARQRHGGPRRRDRRFPSRRALPPRLRHRAGGARDGGSSPDAAATICCARSRSATTSERGSIFSLGFGKLYTERHSTHTLATTFGAAAAAAAMLRLDPRGVRHAFSFAAQQASGVPYWERDREHVEKAFDFGGMGARNGVTAATMIATGFTGVDDFISGNANMFTAIGGEKPRPEEAHRPSSASATRS